MKRIVHVSIANPSLESPLGYNKGKAQLEQAMIDSGLSYAIVRPAVIFGVEDILINNIAWFVRRFPVFGTPVMAGTPSALSTWKTWRDCQCCGPVRKCSTRRGWTRNLLLRGTGTAHCREGKAFRAPSSLADSLGISFDTSNRWFVGDVVLTWEEYKGLMGNLLAPQGPPAGQTRLSEWLSENHERCHLSPA